MEEAPTEVHQAHLALRILTMMGLHVVLAVVSHLDMRFFLIVPGLLRFTDAFLKCKHWYMYVVQHLMRVYNTAVL